jgi:hypothetical protein
MGREPRPPLSDSLTGDAEAVGDLAVAPARRALEHDHGAERECL